MNQEDNGMNQEESKYRNVARLTIVSRNQILVDFYS